MRPYHKSPSHYRRQSQKETNQLRKQVQTGARQLFKKENSTSILDKQQNLLKRMKRFELSTLSLARRCSTTELHPHLDAWASPHDPKSMQHRGALGQAGGSRAGQARVQGASIVAMKACNSRDTSQARDVLHQRRTRALWKNFETSRNRPVTRKDKF